MPHKLWRRRHTPPLGLHLLEDDELGELPAGRKSVSLQLQ